MFILATNFIEVIGYYLTETEVLTRALYDCTISSEISLVNKDESQESTANRNYDHKHEIKTKVVHTQWGIRFTEHLSWKVYVIQRNHSQVSDRSVLQ